MNTISENLDRRFKSLISDEQPSVFFKSLFEYIQYVHSQPTLEAVVIPEIELRAAKTKLLATIEKTGIDTNSFQRFRLWGNSGNIIEELTAFEKGTYSKSGWYSDNLEHYIFDIAANLRAAGHGAELSEFIVSPEQYDKYWRSIDGPGHYTIYGDERNAFIFSQSWPKRFQVMALTEKERSLKLWGDFEALLRFERAYEAISKNGNFSTILRDEDIHTMLDADEKVAIANMGEDLLILIGDGKDTYKNRYSHTPNRIDYLHVKTFRPHAQRVHISLMEALEKPGINSQTKELSAASKKKLFILEKLKEEWDLTSKRPVTTHANFGYSYTRPAGEAKISQQKFSRWMGEDGVSDWYEIESILGGFQEEGLISEFRLQSEYE
jgi:hypothetical protein